MGHVQARPLQPLIIGLSSPMNDPMTPNIVIRNATVIDGSGAPRYTADIALKDGVIAGIGRDIAPGDEEIDATSLVAAPGFIDAHTHDDRLMLSSPDMA